MKRKKKFFILFLTIILSFSLCSAFFGCSKTDDTDKKYDVAIKVGCSDGSEVIFDTDVDEISITRSYDAKSYRYYVKEYNLPNHPEWGDIWVTPSGEGANVFSVSILFWDLDGNQKVISDRTVKDKGYYSIAIIAESTSDLWNYRSCRLYITVI